MRVPIWLTLGVAGLVVLFGAYRLWLAFRPTEDGGDTPRKGLYRMGKRTHLLVGIVYLLLGGALVATSFGWNPFGGSGGAPATDKGTSGSDPIPLDHSPPAS